MKPVWLAQTRHILFKDFQREWRTREVSTTTLAFSLMLMVIFAFGFYRHGESAASVFPGVLWISILFTGTLVLTRSFDHEKDGQCLRALALIPGTHISLFVSKFFVNLVFMTGFQVALLPMLAFTFDVEFGARLGELLLAMLGATIGISALGTVVAAMLVHIQMRDVFLPVVLFPMTSPFLIAGVKITADVLGGSGKDVPLWMLSIFVGDVIFILVGAALFRSILSAIE